MNLFDSGSVYNIPFKDDSEGIADTTTDSDTALNLANGKHGYVEKKVSHLIFKFCQFQQQWAYVELSKKLEMSLSSWA